MKSTSFALIALVVAVVVVGGGIFFTTYHQPASSPQQQNEPTATPVDTSAAAPANFVVYESVSGGKYTFSGYVPVTSSCDTLSSSLFVPNGNATALVLRLSILEVGGSNCTQTSGQSQNFSDTFEPSGTSTKVALQSVLFNGTPATFTIQNQ